MSWEVEFKANTKKLVKTLLELTRADKLEWSKDSGGYKTVTAINGWTLTIKKELSTGTVIRMSHADFDESDFDSECEWIDPWLSWSDPSLNQLYVSAVENETRFRNKLNCVKEPAKPLAQRDAWKELFNGLEKLK